MNKHEEKTCPRCGGGFECKAGNLTQCQCAVVVLDEDDHQYIGLRYADCLCAKCLNELKKERQANS